MYNNYKTVLGILMNAFCGQDKLHKLMSVENDKYWIYQRFSVSVHIIMILKMNLFKQNQN